MADTSLPNGIIQWMADRNWGEHHLEWHTIRQWDLLPPSAVAEAESLGWARADVQEGQAGNGSEFLMMHRAMLHMLREQFPADAGLFSGWATPPTNPNDPADPVPVSLPSSSRPFSAAMSNAIQRIENGAATFASEDEFGLFIETTVRPTLSNPAARSPDPASGIHNYLHNRFSDPSSSVDMGDPSRNLNNRRFWRLHGWIDSMWSRLRTAKGLSDTDAGYLARLEAEKLHMMGHHHEHGMEGLELAAMDVMPKAVSKLAGRTISATLRSPFAETPAKKFHAAVMANKPIANVEELKSYLQVAISLELATMPPYLTAMWSLKNGGEHASIIRGIAFQEMVHLGLACNLLKAIGGSPVLTTLETVVQYPDFLPGVDLGMPVDIAPLSTDRVKLFMRLEKPVEPIPPQVLESLNVDAVPKYPTIGEFYTAIETAFNTLHLPNPFVTQGQIQFDELADPIFIIPDVAKATEAIRLIRDQGEGTPPQMNTPNTQGAPGSLGLAHYYLFQQMDVLKKYVPNSNGNGTFVLDPSKPLPFPASDAIYNMATIAQKGGYPNYADAVSFDQLFSGMLSDLQKAWEGEGNAAIDRAVSAMLAMKKNAQKLMKIPIPGGTGNYGPAFVLRPLSPITPPPPAPSPPILTPVTMTTDYPRIQTILDEAIHGENIGAHGAFWRTLNRDQFVAKVVFGKKLIAQKPDGSFDSNESNLIKALEGRAPFGADLPTPPPGAILNRMPDGFPPVPQAKIDEIRNWISAGCPAVAAALPGGENWVDPAAGGPQPAQIHLDYWREFDNWAMWQASDEVQAAIGEFFPIARQWMALAKGQETEAAWIAAVSTPAVRAAILLLESKQRETVVKYYGRPVALKSLADSYRRFGDNSLPNDEQRPDDKRHSMNGTSMWFIWSAFADATIRVSASQAEVPKTFWNGMARAILIGAMNDGLIRGRFPVPDFPATPAGQDALQVMVLSLPDAEVPNVLAKVYRESGFAVPAPD